MAYRFGLNQDPVFTPAPGVSTYAGFGNLITFTGQPEGLLLRKISSIREGLDFGGVLLLQGTSWLFYVGSTLVEAMSREKLGYFCDAATGEALTYRRVEAMDGFTQDAVGNQVTKKGGRFLMNHELRPFFDTASGPVYAMGIVTGATEGFGHGAAVATNMMSPNTDFFAPGSSTNPSSYVSTVVPMDLTFEAFFNTVLTRALDLVPSNIRSYYVTTYAEAMNTFPHRLVRPSIGVNTHWVGSAIATSRSKYKHVAGVAYANKAPVMDNTYTNLAGVTTTSVLPVGPAYPTYNYPQVCFKGNRAGHFPYRNVDCFVPPMALGADAAVNFTSTGTVGFGGGVIGGLQVGIIRDAQVLIRSVMLGTRYADAPAGFANLSEYVMSQADTTGNIMTRLLNPDQMKGNSLGINIAVAAENEWVAQESIYSRGNVCGLLEKFDAHWNGKALAAATA